MCVCVYVCAPCVLTVVAWPVLCDWGLVCPCGSCGSFATCASCPLASGFAHDVCGCKNASGNAELLDLFAATAGVQREESDMDLGASAPRVQNLLDTRANAFVMCKSGHLRSGAVYTKRFLLFHTKRPAEHFRPADRAIMREVFQLVFAGRSVDDALHHVVVERDMLRLLLIERPKVPKTL